MLRRSLIILVVVLTAAIAYGQESAVGHFEKSKYPFEIPQKFPVPVERGYLIVPAFHDQPGKLLFRLPVAIFHTQSQNARPDPLVYLHDGPGAPPLPRQPISLYSALTRITSDRDIILFDRRGTGYAEPSLNCPTYDRFRQQSFDRVPDFAYYIALAKRLKQCIVRLTGQNVNFRAFNTIESARDLEMLRKALG